MRRPSALRLHLRHALLYICKPFASRSPAGYLAMSNIYGWRGLRRISARHWASSAMPSHRRFILQIRPLAPCGGLSSRPLSVLPNAESSLERMTENRQDWEIFRASSSNTSQQRPASGVSYLSCLSAISGVLPTPPLEQQMASKK